MRVLDLFCGAGGAGMGYAQAGWDVTGVDIKPQPRYPMTVLCLDATWYLEQIVKDGSVRQYDAIHASPPCQAYSNHVSSAGSKWAGTRGRMESRLIEQVRDLLLAAGLPYVIENVAGARPYLWNPMELCGVMFGLPIARHRYFETNAPLAPPAHLVCKGKAAAYAAERGWEARDMTVTGKGRRAGTLERWSEVMGIDWPMTQHEMREAIPPAYTRWIGGQLLESAERAA